MDKRKFIYVIIGFITFAFIALTIGIFMNKKVVPQEPMQLNQSIYYVEKESSSLKEEQRVIGGKTLLEMLTNAIIQMRTTPQSETLAVAIPENVDVLEIALKNEIATINISADYNSLKTGDAMFCRAALVWTITGFYFVDEVEILVDGVPLTKTNGEPYGPMGRDDLIVNAQIEAEPTNSSRIFRLFFANENATALVSEDRRVEVNPNQPVEKYIMEQLIIGPKEKGNVATVPAETKIRNIQTQDGICYVDLSQDFVSKHMGGSTGELLTIYSIVDSLCQLNGVEKVQFLIEGEKQEEFKGHIDFGKPFEAQTIEAN